MDCWDLGGLTGCQLRRSRLVCEEPRPGTLCTPFSFEFKTYRCALQISTVWHVSDSKKSTFDAAPNVQAECADGNVATSKIVVNLGFGAAFFAVGAVAYKQIVGKSSTVPGVDAGPGRYAKVSVVPENA